MKEKTTSTAGGSFFNWLSTEKYLQVNSGSLILYTSVNLQNYYEQRKTNQHNQSRAQRYKRGY